MSVLGDLLLDVITDGVLPESPKARSILFGLIGLAFVAVDGWILVRSPDPLNQPHWSFGALVGSIVYGMFGTLVVALHLRDDECDRRVTIPCLLANALAIAVPLVWFAFH